MSKRRADPAQNPWLLLAGVAAVAVFIYGATSFAGGGAATLTSADPSPAPTATTSSSSTPTAGSPTTASRNGTGAGTKRAGGLSQKKIDRLLRKAKKKNRKRRVETQVVPTSGRSGTGLQLGGSPLPVNAPTGVPVTGTVTTSVANLPFAGGRASSLRTLTAPGPDFVFLNEVFNVTPAGVEGMAPGYSAYRDPVVDRTRGGNGQSLNNMVMWRSDRWTLYDAGRIKVVNDDQGFLGKKAFVWDRYLIWAVLQRTDGAVVSIVSTHMPTNPGKTPRQHGNPPMSRVAQYAQGMDIVVSTINDLSAFGPVLFAGDMNSHPGQGSWTASAKMAAAGYPYVKDQGVMYLFYPSASASVATHRQVRVNSDHPAIITTLKMNG